MSRDQFLKILELADAKDPESQILAVDLINSDEEFLKENQLGICRRWQLAYSGVVVIETQGKTAALWALTDLKFSK